MKILDCTLRDGGYYTKWDFDKALCATYFDSLNQLPVDYIEVGYRSKPLEGYYGEYFYLPDYIIKRIKSGTNKKIAVMLNEKDCNLEDLELLLCSIVDYIDMVRLAVNPNNIKRALKLAVKIKSLGLEVAFNLMYMSKWSSYPGFLTELPLVNGHIDYLYMVDSYGSVYPEDVDTLVRDLKQITNVPLGFHGHNNLEMGLINTLRAIENGVDMVDSTLTGMGRGAGNLKTELLLTVLHSKGLVDFDFNPLSKVVDTFSELKKHYEWGANLPYMVSGATSSPQKQVMEWVSNRSYSFNSIIRAIRNTYNGMEDNERQIPSFCLEKKINKVVVVGGGYSVQHHSVAIQKYLEREPKIAVIHASSKNAMAFKNLLNMQIFCLVGNEGIRMEDVFVKGNIPENLICVLPAYPRTMGTYIPVGLVKKTMELGQPFTDKYEDSHTALALQAAIELGAETVEIIGYDGYSNDNINKKEQDLILENEFLFSCFKNHTNIQISSLTQSNYAGLSGRSVYESL